MKKIRKNIEVFVLRSKRSFMSVWVWVVKWKIACLVVVSITALLFIFIYKVNPLPLISSLIFSFIPAILFLYICYIRFKPSKANHHFIVELNFNDFFSKSDDEIINKLIIEKKIDLYNKHRHSKIVDIAYDTENELVFFTVFIWLI